MWKLTDVFAAEPTIVFAGLEAGITCFKSINNASLAGTETAVAILTESIAIENVAAAVVVLVTIILVTIVVVVVFGWV
jgi:hypothetical protein